MATSIINFTASNTSDFLSNAVNLIDDIKPIAVIVIAIFLGFFVVKTLILIFLKKEEQ